MSILRTALYCRLSKDDMLQGDSESIKTQKAMLTQYAKEHNFLVVDIYVDDGYSGLNFDRPSFNRIRICYRFGGYIGEHRFNAMVLRNTGNLEKRHLKERNGNERAKISSVS